MPSCTGGNRDGIPKGGSFIQKCGIFLFHAHRTASAPDVSGEREKLFHRNQRHILVPGGFCRLLQIQFTAHRDAENIHPRALPPGDQRFKNLLRRKSYGGSGVKPAEILFVKFIKHFPARDPGLLDQPQRVCFF